MEELVEEIKATPRIIGMNRRERRIFLLMGLLMLFLYTSGVFTGFFLYDASVESTKDEILNLQRQLDGYKQRLEYARLEQLYLASSDEELSCRFMILSIQNLQNDLSYFLKDLPHKLEIYEKEGKATPEYKNLKRDYMFLSVKMWMLSSLVKKRCRADIVPVLYFYSSECNECVEQGLVLDRIRKKYPNAWVFTLDFNLDEKWLDVIKDAYGVKKAPSLVIGNVTHAGLMDFESLDSEIGRILRGKGNN